MSDTAEPSPSPTPPPSQEGRGDGARWIGDVWQWLGMGGALSGTTGIARRTFLYAYLVAAVVVAAVNTVNVITTHHEQPQFGLMAPVIWEGTSWITLILFFPIVWISYRLAPPSVRPRWELLAHIPGVLLYSLAHVGGFVALRKLIYGLAGTAYDYGSFFPHFLYELAKDVIGYGLFIATFALIEHLLRQQSLIKTPEQTLTFDIRDGAKLNRVRLDQVLAIGAAGNYAEFNLKDGRKLLMRSPLSTLENELRPRGFLRTHRSWIVNATQMTSLRPEGSGDYTVELGSLAVPLSRRFPDALAKLRQ